MYKQNALNVVLCCVNLGIVTAAYPLDVRQDRTAYQGKHLRMVREASPDPYNRYGGFGGGPGFGVPGFGRPGFGRQGYNRPGFGGPGFGGPGFGGPGFGRPGFGRPGIGGPGVGSLDVGGSGAGGPGVGGPVVGRPGIGGPGVGIPNSSFSNSLANSFTTMIQTPFGGFSISSSNAFGGSANIGG